MGDHRASIKIEFEFHGKTYKMDSWVNYFPDGDGVDRRVQEFFEKAYNDGMRRYQDELFEADRERREREQEEADRAEYARLKAKFGP